VKAVYSVEGNSSANDASIRYRAIRIIVVALLFTFCLIGQPALAQVSTRCHFTNGPLAGTTQDFAPLAPLPVGTPCNNGLGSYGVIVPVSVAQWRTAKIPSQDLPEDPGAQDTPVTCWAASIAYIFSYYNHDVSQDLIWAKYYSSPHTADPTRLTKALNTSWMDSDSQSFTVQSQVTDRFFGTASQVDNQDVVDALNNGTPVFYGTMDHAMVLVSVKYRDTPNGPDIAEGVVWDPNPPYHHNNQGGIRTVMGPDIRAMYVAIPSIQ